MHTGTNRSETVLMSQPEQVSQFMRRDFGGESHKIVTGGRRLRRTNFRLVHGTEFALEGIRITLNFPDSIKAGDHPAQQAVDLHDSAATQVHVAGIDFARQSAWSTGIRRLVEKDGRVLRGLSDSSKRRGNVIQHGHDTHVKPRRSGIRTTIDGFDSLADQFALVNRVECTIRINMLAHIRQTCDRVNDAGVRVLVKVQEHPLRDSARCRYRTTERFIKVRSADVVTAGVAVDRVSERCADDVLHRHAVCQHDPQLPRALRLP